MKTKTETTITSPIWTNDPKNWNWKKEENNTSPLYQDRDFFPDGDPFTSLTSTQRTTLTSIFSRLGLSGRLSPRTTRGSDRNGNTYSIKGTPDGFDLIERKDSPTDRSSWTLSLRTKNSDGTWTETILTTDRDSESTIRHLPRYLGFFTPEMERDTKDYPHLYPQDDTDIPSETTP